MIIKYNSKIYSHAQYLDEVTYSKFKDFEEYEWRKATYSTYAVNFHLLVNFFSRNISFAEMTGFDNSTSLYKRPYLPHYFGKLIPAENFLDSITCQGKKQNDRIFIQILWYTIASIDWLLFNLLFLYHIFQHKKTHLKSFFWRKVPIWSMFWWLLLN